MSASKIILTTIMAVIYSFVLKYFERSFGLDKTASLITLIILILVTGYLFAWMDYKKNKK